jgi:hypothetical protein
LYSRHGQNLYTGEIILVKTLALLPVSKVIDMSVTPEILNPESRAFNPAQSGIPAYNIPERIKNVRPGLFFAIISIISMPLSKKTV